MLLVFSLMMAEFLMVIYYIYNRVQIQPSYQMRKLLRSQELVLCWCFFMILEIIAPNEELVIVFSTIKMIFVTYMAFVIMEYSYAMVYQKPFKGIWFIVLLIPPTMSSVGLIAISILKISSGRNFDAEIKILATVVMIYYIISIMYFTIKLKNSNEISYIQKGSYYFFIISTSLYVHAIFILDILNKNFLILAYILPLFLCLLALITRRYSFYDPMPFLLETILGSVKYGILVVNNSLEIVDYNKIFFQQIIEIDQYESLKDFLAEIKKSAMNPLSVDNIYSSISDLGPNPISGELKLKIRDIVSDYVYYMSPLYDSKRRKIATLITFRNITEILELNDTIESKNIELADANKQLQKHLKQVRELTIEYERDLLMREINNTFGHSMTEILALLEVSALLLDQPLENAIIEKGIQDAIDRARGGLCEIRESVARYKKGVTDSD